ncbi:MAG: S8 family serine peptidase [Nitriliruptorales bacterium]
MARARNRRFAAVVTLLILGLTPVPGFAAPRPEARPLPTTASAAAPGDPGAPLPELDLATHPSERWIVQLAEPPAVRSDEALARPEAASPRTGGGRFARAARETQAYLRFLHDRQLDVAETIARAAPGAKVERSYQVVLNGLAVAMSPDQADVVRRLPGIRAVTPDIPFQLTTYATPGQVGAPAVWERLGGTEQAGDGVKIAVIDSGIYVAHDGEGRHVGNPCFDDDDYTAPPGFPKGDTRFTNDKVIVARAYFRRDDPPTPGDDTPLPGPKGDSHGTHVAGTAACNPATPVTVDGVSVTISGVAPRAYLMNYRVFYPSQSPDDFQNRNAYVAELVDAFDDAVSDGADVISNSWGASYTNTLGWPDPMVEAAEAAVDAGISVVFANGNRGPDQATASSPALSSQVIAVGAVTKGVTTVAGHVDVTGPPPVPAELGGLPAGSARFGPAITSEVGPAPYVPAETVAGDGSTLGCSLPDGASPFPGGSLAGRMALIERGRCELSEKVFNAQRGGALAALVYNHASGGDTLQAMGPGAHSEEVAIPSWFLRRSQGLAMRDFHTAHPGQAQARFTYAPRLASNPADVVASFSSRGPSTEKALKPDLVAPGVDVLSAGYAGGEHPATFSGFGTSSGTSMAAPHATGAAALLRQLHPDWTPAQVKSALVTTASEEVFLSPSRTTSAGVLDRGGGRIDVARAADPGLTFDRPTVSAGELGPGDTEAVTLRATNVDDRDEVWDVVAVEGGGPQTGENFDLSVSRQRIEVGENGQRAITVRITTLPDALPDSYEGAIVFTNRSDGRRLHVPVWLRVVPQDKRADVLLLDDDGSSLDPRFRDYAPIYRETLATIDTSHDYLDLGVEQMPDYSELFHYRAVLLFTGDNDSSDTSGLTESAQNTLIQWLDSGGRLWASGQNLAETTDTNTLTSERLGRSRLYHGYLGLAFQAASLYPGAAPRPTAEGRGPMSGVVVDLSPGGDGAGNQHSIEASSPMPDTDTYQASDTTRPLFLPRGGTQQGTAIAFGRASEPALGLHEPEYRYRTVALGFGLEGINSDTGFATRQEVARRTLAWLFDRITLEVLPTGPLTQEIATFTAQPISSVGARFVSFRWDFGDGSPIQSTTAPTAHHRYPASGTYLLRVEVTDSLGHRAIATEEVDTRAWKLE